MFSRIGSRRRCVAGPPCQRFIALSPLYYVAGRTLIPKGRSFSFQTLQIPAASRLRAVGCLASLGSTRVREVQDPSLLALGDCGCPNARRYCSDTAEPFVLRFAAPCWSTDTPCHVRRDEELSRSFSVPATVSTVHIGGCLLVSQISRRRADEASQLKQLAKRRKYQSCTR